MIPYILYVSLLLTGFLIFYKLLLQKETFFNLNRAVLLSCMLLAFTLPLLPVPQQLSFRKAPAEISVAPEKAIYQGKPAVSVEIPAAVNTADQNDVKKNINTRQVMQWLIYLYWFGVVIFGCNFLMQAALLLYTAYSRQVIKDGRFRIVEISGEKAPCSFLNNIFINPEKYDWETYNQVLLHEKIHIEQKHTLDLLLAEIVLVFQWFNPFAWQWRKELESNLEFVTDEQMLQQDAVEKESYQMSLLKVAAPHFPLSLTTNYNQSLLKKRLTMMNAKKSNMHTTWKYFFLLPLMVLFVCLFNEPVAKSQSIAGKAKGKGHHEMDKGMQTKGNWFATIKDEKMNIQFRNDEDENSSNGTTFKLSEFSNLPKDQKGTFALTREAGTINFDGRFDGDKGMGTYQFTPNKNFAATMQKEGINLATDKDLMVYFIVNINTDYVRMLKRNGYSNLDKDNLIPLAALGVNEAYIASIKQSGLDIDLENLVPFKALNIDKAYIEEIRKAGYKDLSPDKIISLKAQGIDGKFIEDYRNAAKTGENSKIEKKEAKEATEKTEKDEAMSNRDRKKSDDDMDDDIVAFKALHIDPEFINSFKAIGYHDISNSDLIALKALGVTPEYIKSFLNAGFKDLKPEDFVGLKSQNITVALVKEYNELGLGKIDMEDVIGAKATGTTPAYIRSMKAKGHNKNDLGDYIAMKTVVGF